MIVSYAQVEELLSRILGPVEVIYYILLVTLSFQVFIGVSHGTEKSGSVIAIQSHIAYRGVDN